MISDQLPNPLQVRESSSSVTILHANTREEYGYPGHKTPYLLICNFGCCGDYILNNEKVQASDRLFYFANAGDELEIAFRGRHKRETLLMMFDPHMVREATAGWLKDPVELLDDPHAAALHGLAVPSIPFMFTVEFTRLLDKVRQTARGSVTSGLPESVLAAFFNVWTGTAGIMSKIPVISVSGRRELYKRLMVARAFMEANVEAELTIERITAEAMLNRFYFLELFKKVFGVTPHRYLRERKLQRAHELLRSGNSVTEACQLVGYKSIGSFSNLFKSRFGYPPSDL